jgi:YegS/Rv2252/BmrU family lipid kinase
MTRDSICPYANIGIFLLTDVIHQKRAVQQSKGKRAMLIVNPRARRGGGSIDAARQVLVDAGLEIEEMATSKDENASELISRNADHFDIAIVGGGDGTLNNAAAGLAHSGLTLGVLPLGTANDFARTMGISPDPVKAAEVIAAGHQATVDLGEVNGHLFFNVASIGFSAELAGELTEHAKKRWGTLGYGIVAARMLMRSRLFTCYVDHDDTTEKIRTMQVSVGNGRHYGGGMTVEETATADDGWLDLYSLEVDHWWRLLRLLPSLRKGTQGQWDDVRAFKTTEVTIRTKQPRPVNTDGELVTWTPAHFRIRPKSVNVFVPKDRRRRLKLGEGLTLDLITEWLRPGRALAGQQRNWLSPCCVRPCLTGQITCDSAFGRGSPLTVLAGPKMTKLSTARTQTPTPP